MRVPPAAPVAWNHRPGASGFVALELRGPGLLAGGVDEAARKPLCRSISTGSEAIGTFGSIRSSSACSSSAPDGMSSAVSGEMTSSPSSFSRTGQRQRLRGVGALADQTAELHAVRLPPGGGEQAGGRVVVAP